jgi:hypothetical protein
MRVHFTKRLTKEHGPGLQLTTLERDSIAFFNELDPCLIPKSGSGPFTIGDKKYKYWGEVLRLKVPTNNIYIVQAPYLEIIVQEIE